MAAEHGHARRNIKPFNGTRFLVWKQRIFALLEEKGVLDTVEGDPPELLRITDAVRKREAIARSTIIEYLEDNLLPLATSHDTPRDIIKKLSAVYERNSWAAKITCKRRLSELKFKGDISLAEYFSKFDELVVEYQASGGKMDDHECVETLLMSLPPSYDSVSTALQAISDDAINLQIVKQKLLDHEVRVSKEKGETKIGGDTSLKALQVTNTNNPNQFNSRGGFGYSRRGRGARRGRGGRGRGFPGGGNSGGFAKENQTRSGLKCFYCGGDGHFKRNCFHYKRSRGANPRGFNRHTYNNFQQQQQQQYSNEQQQQQPKPAVNTAIQIQDGRMSTNDSRLCFMVGGPEIQSNKEGIVFLIDSGATDHIINDKSLFTTVEQLGQPISLSIAKKEASITATMKGTIDVITNKGVEVVLKDVLYAPALPHNLLSVRKIQQAGLAVTFDEDGGVSISHGNNILATGESLSNLICLRFELKNRVCNQVFDNNKEYKKWHERLGHIGKTRFKEIQRNKLFENTELESIVVNEDEICEACVYGKQSRLPFSNEKDRSHVNRELFAVHSDVGGKISPPTIDGMEYYVTFTDEFTRYLSAYLLEKRSGVFNAFKDYVEKAEAHFNLRVAHLYCDNGTEYLSNEFKDYCQSKGIQYHLTVPYTPQQNGISERINKTLTERARAMLHGAKLDKSLWGEAVLTAVHLVNISPTKGIEGGKTPFELWHKRKPRIDRLRVFGCVVYVHDKLRKSKFDKKSNKGILIGYASSGYKVWDLESNKFIIARDVIFDENSFITSKPVMGIDEDAGVEPGDSTNKRKIEESDDSQKEKEKREKEKKEKESKKGESSDSDLRRSNRIKEKPKVVYKVTDENENGKYSCYSSAQMGKSFIDEVPQSFSEIQDRPDKDHWERAVLEELESLITNHTWEEIECPSGVNVVDCKWVFSIKTDSEGKIVKYKARLVAKGFSQKPMIDYEETFAPVARMTTFRTLLSYANQFNLLIHQMDVKTAFLNGKLDEEIFMKIPEGLNFRGNKVCKLNKSIYGLKQAARCWFETFDKVMKEHNFVNSSGDKCLYILDRGHFSKNIYVLLYVDDTIIVTYDETTMSKFKKYLMDKFLMTDMGTIKYFLGINIERKTDTITLDQTVYLNKILSKFNMDECNPVSTPMESKIDYEELNSDDNYDAPIRNLLGSLMYAMLCTRPDICLSLNVLSRFQSKSNQALWQALKRILRYIKGTTNLKLVYRRNDDYQNVLEGFADADWAKDTIDRISTTGYLFRMFESNTICWNSRRQPSVATSTTHAEYMAMYEAVTEACWLKSLLENIGLKIRVPITIYEDNAGCISISNNPVKHKRCKHIDVKYHFTREKVADKTVILIHVSTGDQLADHLTKALVGGQFLTLRIRTGLE